MQQLHNLQQKQYAKQLDAYVPHKIFNLKCRIHILSGLEFIFVNLIYMRFIQSTLG